MAPRVRPFSPDDYAAIVAISNATYIDYPGTVEEQRYEDEHRDPTCRFQRWVAEVDSRVVGHGSYGQSPDMYHPRKFEVHAVVAPERQRQGIGAALYDHVMAALQPFDPLSVHSDAREDMTQSLRFLQQRGFEERMREWESRLPVASFNPAPFAGAEDAVRAHGIQIKTLAELASDPGRNRKVHALVTEIERDVPSPEPVTEASFDHFVDHLLTNPNILPDAYLIAVDGDQYVGMSNLWASQASADLDTGLTGVVRAYRRKGIALALKLRAIAYAQAHDHPIIKTWNETANEGMLVINQRLGFIRQPAWIALTKVLKAEEEEPAVGSVAST